MRAVLALPPIVRALVISTLLFLLWFGVNWAYHAFNKPSEILFPLGSLTQQTPGRNLDSNMNPFSASMRLRPSHLSFSPH